MAEQRIQKKIDNLIASISSSLIQSSSTSQQSPPTSNNNPNVVANVANNSNPIVFVDNLPHCESKYDDNTYDYHPIILSIYI